MQRDQHDIRIRPFVPSCRPLSVGGWELRVGALCHCPGYWRGPVPVEQMAALVRGGRCWMSMTPPEFESRETGVRLARGHVMIFGVGLGWAAATIAETRLPLVGLQLENYPQRVVRAARARMGGKWLPGPPPPWDSPA